MKKKIIIIFLISLFTGVNGQAISPSYAPPVQISGSIEHGTIKDTFQIIFWKEYIYHLEAAEIINIPLDKAGRFKVQLPPLLHLTRILFQKRGSGFANLGNFPVAPGDSINIRILQKSDDYQLEFSGRGALKYTLHESFLQEKNRFSNERRQIVPKEQPSAALRQLIDLSSAAKNRLGQLLNNNKTLLGQDAFVFLSAEYAAYFDMIIQRETSDHFDNCKDDGCRVSILAQYESYSRRIQNPLDSIRSWSFEYTMSLILGEQTRLSMLKKASGYEFAELFSIITSNYDGLLREKLLMTALSNPSIKAQSNDTRQETFDSCLTMAFSLTKTPYIKNKLANMINVFSKGRPAYPFKFEDEHGQIVKLEDFRGKVVLLHMWFTSCSGCIQFTDKLEKTVLPAIKEYSNFKVVSICTDENRQQWLKSLSKGIYTGKEDINLYTGGASFYDLSMVKHYQIQGMPFILLVDASGNISAQFSNRQAEKDIIATIKTTLEQTAKN